MDQAINLLLSLFNKFGWFGNWLFFLLASLECLPFFGSFFPGGTIVYAGGFLAAQGYFNIYYLIAFSAAGAIVGDYLAYSLGRRSGRRLVGRIINEKLLVKGEQFFARYGHSSILLGRFIAATRAIVPFVIGVSQMKPWPFMFWNTIGAIVWATFNALLGYFSGNLVNSLINRYPQLFIPLLTTTLLIIIIYWLGRKYQKRIKNFIIQIYFQIIDKLVNGAWLQSLEKKYPLMCRFSQNCARQGRVAACLISLLIIILTHLGILTNKNFS